MSEEKQETETIRIRIDARFEVPKGEFSPGHFDLDAAAEAIIRSHFADEWWVDGREVGLGPVRATVNNESALKAIKRRR